MIGSKTTKKINLTPEDKIFKIKNLDINTKRKIKLEAEELMNDLHNKTSLTEKEQLLVSIYTILINEF